MTGIWGPPTRHKEKYKEKALKLMGVKPIQVLQTFLTTNGTINAHEYSVYWEQMHRQCSTYLRVIVDELFTVLETGKKPSVPIESICNTIAFITLTTKFVPDMAFKNVLKKWDTQTGGKTTRAPTEQMIDVIRLLKRRAMELEHEQMRERAIKEGLQPPPPQQGTQSLVSSLVVQASTMLFREELPLMKDPIHFATIHGFKPSLYGAHCFAYNFLRTYSNQSYEHRKEVLDILLDQLLTLRQQRQINYQLCQANLLALLHMVQQFVSLYRVDAEFIERAQQVIKQFYLWPIPYGDFAMYSLILLKKELKAPGSELLRRFAHESTVPEVQGYKTLTAGHELRDALYNGSRPVWYFIHANNPHAAELASIMQLDFDIKDNNQREQQIRQPNEQAGLPVEITCLLLLNAINYDVGIEDTDFTNVRWLSEEDVYNFFDETVAVLGKALEKERTIQEAQQIRLTEFRKLKQKIHQKAIHNSSTPPRGYTPVNLSNLNKNLPADFMPPLPPVAHIVMPLRLYYHKSQFRPTDPASDVVPVPRTHAFECIEKLQAEWRHLADVDSAVRLRIVIGGGDQNLHTVVCAWVSFMNEYVDMLKGIEVQFYLVPFEENHLASFIARHDCWYKRHIYTPFRAHQFLLPSCDEGRRYFDNPQSKSGDSERELLPHGIFLREAVEDYIRDANHTIKVNLFKVAVWRYPENAPEKRQKVRGSKSARLLGQQSHLPDKQIPFCQRVDIGYFAEVRKHKEKAHSDQTQSKKKFDYTPVDVNVSVYPVDATGQEIANFHDLGCGYQQISLSNVPFDKDASFPANPLNSYLEMYADVSESNKKVNKANVLHRENLQHVKKVSIRSTSPDVQFSVLIDGSTFGPYHRIDVSPFMNDVTNEPITLPIRTFFPIDSQV